MAQNGANVDWEKLAEDLGSFVTEGVERSGTQMACEAIARIMGADVIRSAVDHYVMNRRGSQLARSVLWHVHPWAAMERCHAYFEDSDDLEIRRAAVELMRAVADSRAAEWIPAYLGDPDPMIQEWGAGIVDQLIYLELIEVEDYGDLLDLMANHSNEQVRAMHKQAISWVAEDAGAT